MTKTTLSSLERQSKEKIDLRTVQINLIDNEPDAEFMNKSQSTMVNSKPSSLNTSKRITDGSKPVKTKGNGGQRSIDHDFGEAGDYQAKGPQRSAQKSPRFGKGANSNPGVRRKSSSKKRRPSPRKNQNKDKVTTRKRSR